MTIPLIGKVFVADAPNMLRCTLAEAQMELRVTEFVVRVEVVSSRDNLP